MRMWVVAQLSGPVSGPADSTPNCIPTYVQAQFVMMGGEKYRNISICSNIGLNASNIMAELS